MPTKSGRPSIRGHGDAPAFIGTPTKWRRTVEGHAHRALSAWSHAPSISVLPRCDPSVFRREAVHSDSRIAHEPRLCGPSRNYPTTSRVLLQCESETVARPPHRAFGRGDRLLEVAIAEHAAVGRRQRHQRRRDRRPSSSGSSGGLPRPGIGRRGGATSSRSGANPVRPQGWRAERCVTSAAISIA